MSSISRYTRLPITLSFLRPRAIHTTRILLDTAQNQPPRSTNPNPTDVISSKTPGPAIIESDSEEMISTAIVSGAPTELRYRQCRIFKPSKAVNQSAKGKSNKWVLDWDVLPGAGRWENDLMGWASSADYVQATNVAFRTKEEAVAFAEKQGWDYQVCMPKEPKIPPKSYANNYVHVPGKLRIHHTK